MVREVTLPPTQPLTANGCWEIKSLLGELLPFPEEVILTVMDFAEVWTQTSVARYEWILHYECTEREPYISIPVEARKKGLRKVVFRTRSCDQGIWLFLFLAPHLLAISRLEP